MINIYFKKSQTYELFRCKDRKKRAKLVYRLKILYHFNVFLAGSMYFDILEIRENCIPQNIKEKMTPIVLPRSHDLPVIPLCIKSNQTRYNTFHNLIFVKESYQMMIYGFLIFLQLCDQSHISSKTPRNCFVWYNQNVCIALVSLETSCQAIVMAVIKNLLMHVMPETLKTDKG